MFAKMASLGLGLVTAMAAFPAAAHESYGRAPNPGYGPRAPAPMYAPAPVRPERPMNEREAAAVLRGADYNRDGGITLGEANAYGRTQFRRDDFDGNGVLTVREVRGCNDELARGVPGNGVVTFAEYDANLQREFYRLDRNRDGFLSGYDLGTSAPRPAAGMSWSWHWSL